VIQRLAAALMTKLRAEPDPRSDIRCVGSASALMDDAVRIWKTVSTVYSSASRYQSPKATRRARSRQSAHAATRRRPGFSRVYIVGVEDYESPVTSDDEQHQDESKSSTLLYVGMTPRGAVDSDTL